MKTDGWHVFCIILKTYSVLTGHLLLRSVSKGIHRNIPLDKGLPTFIQNYSIWNLTLKCDRIILFPMVVIHFKYVTPLKSFGKSAQPSKVKSTKNELKIENSGSDSNKNQVNINFTNISITPKYIGPRPTDHWSLKQVFFTETMSHYSGLFDNCPIYKLVSNHSCSIQGEVI